MRKIICLFASAIAVVASAFAGRIVDEAFMSNYVNRVVAERVTKLVNLAEENANDWGIAANGKLEKEFVIIGADGLPERTKVQYDVSCEETRIEKLGCKVVKSTHPKFKAGDLLACVHYEWDDDGCLFVNKNIILSEEDDYGYAQMWFDVETDYDELTGEWREYYALVDNFFDSDYYFKRSTDEIEVTYYDDDNQEIGVVVFAPRRLSDAEYNAIVPNDDNNFETVEYNDWAEIAHPQTLNFTLTFKEINPALNNGTGSVSAPRIALTANRKVGGANTAASVLNIPLGADDDDPPPDDDLPPDDPDDPPPPDDPLPDDPLPEDPPPDEPPPDDPTPPAPPQGTTKVNVSVNQVCNAPMIYLDDDTACDIEDHEGCYWKPNPTYLEVDWYNPNSWITLPISGSIEYHDANGNLVGTAPIAIESWAELVRIFEGQGHEIPQIPPYAYEPSVVIHNDADNCKRGKHNWVNCKCKRCGAIRQHDFVCKDDNCATCVNMNTDTRGKETEECGLQCPYSQEEYHRGWHHEQFDANENYCCSCQCGLFSVGKSLKAHSYVRMAATEPEWYDNDFHEIEEKCSRCPHIRKKKEKHTYDSKDSESRPIVYEDGTMNGKYHLTTGYCIVCDKNKAHMGNEMFVEHTIKIVGGLCQCLYCFDKDGYDSEALHDIDDVHFDDCYNYGCRHSDIETGEPCLRAVSNAVTGLEPPNGLKMHWPCQEDSSDDKQHFCLCHYLKYDHEYDYEYDGYKFCAGENSDKYDLDLGWFEVGFANHYCGHAVEIGGHGQKGKCKWNPDHDSNIDDDLNRDKNDPRKLNSGSSATDDDNPEPLPDDPPPDDQYQRDIPKECKGCGSRGKKTYVVSRSQEFKVLATKPTTGFGGMPLAILPMQQLVGVEHKDVLDTWGERSTKPYRWTHTYYTGVQIRWWPSWMGGRSIDVDENEPWIQNWINGK